MTREPRRRSATRKAPHAKEKPLVDVVVRVREHHEHLIREAARRLTSGELSERKFRAMLLGVKIGSVLEMFASKLPDEYFEGVFDHKRDISNRKVDFD
jgi:hypothetical protein